MSMGPSRRAGKTHRTGPPATIDLAAGHLGGSTGGERACLLIISQLPLVRSPTRTSDRKGAFLTAAVACNEGLLRVDGGPSFILRKSAAVGGLPTFANLVTNGKDGPIPPFG